MSNQPLPNARHERFAQERAKGKSVDEAYQIAGFKANRGNASRLNAIESIQLRIAHLQAKGAEKAGVTTERIVSELAKIGFSDLRKAVKWGPKRGKVGEADVPGVEIVDSDDLDEATAAAIAEVSQTKDGLKIKLHDKRAALVDLGRHLNMFKDDLTKTGDIHIHFDGQAKGVL